VIRLELLQIQAKKRY